LDLEEEGVGNPKEGLVDSKKFPLWCTWATKGIIFLRALANLFFKEGRFEVGPWTLYFLTS